MPCPMFRDDRLRHQARHAVPLPPTARQRRDRSVDANVSAPPTATAGELPRARERATGTGVDVRYNRPWHAGLDRFLLWLVLGIGAIAMVGPFYWMLVTSFKIRQELIRYPPTWWPEEFTWRNWQALNDLPAGSFNLFFRNSFFVAT